MRSKEDANDYRYFPCPDLLPIDISESMLDDIKATMIELPQARIDRLMSAYKLSQEEAAFLTHSKGFCDYFETICKASKDLSKLAINWLKGEVSAKLNKEGLSLIESPVSAEHLASLLQAIDAQVIPNNTAKKVFNLMWQRGETASVIIEREGLAQSNDTAELEAIVKKIIKNNPNQVAQYQAGKTKLLGFFVGQVMKETKGKANPKLINELVFEMLRSI